MEEENDGKQEVDRSAQPTITAVSDRKQATMQEDTEKNRVVRSRGGVDQLVRSGRLGKPRDELLANRRAPAKRNYLTYLHIYHEDGLPYTVATINDEGVTSDML